MTRWWPLLLVLACAGCELADADELLFGPPVGSGVVSLPFDATQSPGCMSWDGTAIDTNPSNPACAGGGGSPAPTVTPFACSAGYAVQVVGATPGCVLLPTPDGAGAGAAATQTPWSCGAGNGARGMGSTPECFVVPTPDGAGAGAVATVTPGGGTPQPIATSTSAPGTAAGYARVDHVHHLADGSVGPAKLSAAVPTPLPTATSVAFTNQPQTFTGGQQFNGDVFIAASGTFTLDGSGRFTPNFFLQDDDGNNVITFDPTGAGVLAASGTGVNRANDVVCTGCIGFSDLGFATATPVPTVTPTLTVTPTPTATVTTTPVVCSAGSALDRAHPEACVVLPTPDGIGLTSLPASPTPTVGLGMVLAGPTAGEGTPGPARWRRIFWADIADPLSTTTPVPTVTPTPILCPTANGPYGYLGGLFGAHPESCLSVVTPTPTATVTATPTATVTITPIACPTSGGEGGFYQAHPELCKAINATPTPKPSPTAPYPVTVQEGDSTVEAAAATLDFLSTDFDVTSSPSGEANIALDANVVKVGGASILSTQLPTSIAADGVSRCWGDDNDWCVSYNATAGMAQGGNVPLNLGPTPTVTATGTLTPTPTSTAATPTPTGVTPTIQVTPTATGATVTPTPLPIPPLVVRGREPRCRPVCTLFANSNATTYYAPDGVSTAFQHVIKVPVLGPSYFRNLVCRSWDDAAAGERKEVTIRSGSACAATGADGAEAQCTWTTIMRADLIGTFNPQEWRMAGTPFSTGILTENNVWQWRVVDVNNGGGGWVSCCVELCDEP